MSRKLRKSFVRHPGAILFLLFSREGVFQQPQAITPTTPVSPSRGLYGVRAALPYALFPRSRVPGTRRRTAWMLGRAPHGRYAQHFSKRAQAVRRDPVINPAGFVVLPRDFLRTFITNVE